MTSPDQLTRRSLFMRIGILLNGIVGAILAVPVVRYLLSPVALDRKGNYESWVLLGDLDQFPSGQTRLATYRNPIVNPTDGDTADIACWVRNVDGQSFQVFAINCAHLGCPVRWFPQSGLFMCPCHGGVYYENGEHASGPPPRGLYHCVSQVVDGKVEIQAPHLPTLQDTLKENA